MVKQYLMKLELGQVARKYKLTFTTDLSFTLVGSFIMTKDSSGCLELARLNIISYQFFKV